MHGWMYGWIDERHAKVMSFEILEGIDKEVHSLKLQERILPLKNAALRYFFFLATDYAF